jgi:nitrate/TMAO reductase-like tetraheme cytochrome c subunit
MSEETPNTPEERRDKSAEKQMSAGGAVAADATGAEAEATEASSGPKVPSLYRNYISFAGTAIAAAALMSIIFLILIEFTSPREQPYLDLFTYLLFPSILLFGLFIVLVGILFERRRRRKYKPSEIAAYPVLDLNSPRQRRTFLVLLVAAFLFLFISAFGSYRVFEYSESVTFCGQACHVMKPEFTAYNASPHARIACVECHVGGGAEWYLRAKFNGMRQLYAVTFDTYHRPIQTPVHNMRPADDTCAKCHWSEKFHGDKIKIFNHFGYDEKNSLNQTRLLIKVGGGSPERGPVSGIHWHMNIGNEITYIATDEKRQQIPWVRMKDRDGNVVEYMSKDANLSPAQIESAPKRRMDCIDCHNRPAHVYLSPAKAVDDALAANKLDVSLPFMKLKAVEVLSRQYNTTDEAVGSIASGLDEYYRTNHAGLYSAKKDSIDNAVKEVQRIYQTYFFPEMKTDWQSHADNIGHYYAQGCFRCHDGQHFSREGKVIRNECGICHTTIDQTFGGKTLTPPNGEFKHPVNLGDKNTWQCAACHKANKPFVHPLNLGDISQFQCAECHKGQSFKMNFTRQE